MGDEGRDRGGGGDVGDEGWVADLECYVSWGERVREFSFFFFYFFRQRGGAREKGLSSDPRASDGV